MKLRRLVTSVDVLLFAIALLMPLAVRAQQAPIVHSSFQKGDFRLVSDRRAASIIVADEDFTVVHIAAQCLASDIELVSRIHPDIRSNLSTPTRNTVLIGTIGKSTVIDNLVTSEKLDISGIKGKWETFLITTVINPMPGVDMGLVIVGSDRRGTAFGVFELSQMIGVSPWYWWADVRPEPKSQIFIAAGARREGPPSVQYRGIFLNDEDWGLQPWAANAFEPDTHDIGPKTYARIFELLLRLKANTIWPAMHQCTRAFNLIPENQRVADDYGIVMGSSHAEPMLRNNVTEWTARPEDFNYLTKPDVVKAYWEQAVVQHRESECIYTIGMRGIHDSPIQGPVTPDERKALLEKIFADQRDMLRRNVNSDIESIPQIFCPYKEVLTDFENGLKVPDDVTVVFPDDNFGYIRKLPLDADQKRKGGYGIYYHISYLGRPLSYLWLETTPPGLIWEEMSRAYDHNVRRFWMLNVGDLKPGEIGTELFLEMAWDINRWRRDNQKDFLKTWARREFGEEDSAEIASIMEEYYRLNYQRKPEHLQWFLPGEPWRESDYTTIANGDEVQQRLDSFQQLVTRTNQIYSQIPTRLKDAFYELVVYPVRVSALANQKYFLLEQSRIYAAQRRASTQQLVARAKAADAQIAFETSNFNNTIAGGKWRGIMTAELPKGQWQSMRTASPFTQDVQIPEMPKHAGLGVAIEGRLAPLEIDRADASLPTFNACETSKRFIDVFNTGSEPAVWKAWSNSPWIRLSTGAGNLSNDTRVQVSIDWNKAPKLRNLAGAITISSGVQQRSVLVNAVDPRVGAETRVSGFVEVNGLVAIEAGQFAKSVSAHGSSWQIINGLGRNGDSVAGFPTNRQSLIGEINASSSAEMEYPFYLLTSGDSTLTAELVPTHAASASSGLRFGVSVDDCRPVIVTVDAGVDVTTRKWALNVLNASTTGTVGLGKLESGPHVLKIWLVDTGVVLDKFVISMRQPPPSYLGPPDTPYVSPKAVTR